MNIFFTASVRGGRAQQPSYEAIVRALGAYGRVFSRHVSDDALSHYGETSLSASEILEREVRALEKSDVVVAETTVPSLGVGYLIARATALGKRVVALHQGMDTLQLSAVIKGDPLVEVRMYKGKEDIENLFAETFGADVSS